MLRESGRFLKQLLRAIPIEQLIEHTNVSTVFQRPQLVNKAVVVNKSNCPLFDTVKRRYF